MDLQLTQDVRLPGSNKRFQVMLNAENLFDQDQDLDVFRNYTRETVPLTAEDFLLNGLPDIDQYLSTHPSIRKDPRFLQANTFQGFRTIRVGAKFSF